MQKEISSPIEKKNESRELPRLKEIRGSNINFGGEVRSGGLNFSNIEILGMDEAPEAVHTERKLSEGLALGELFKQMELAKSAGLEVEALENIKYLSEEEMKGGVLDWLMSSMEDLGVEEKMILVSFGNNGEDYCVSLIDKAVEGISSDEDKTSIAIRDYLSDRLVVLKNQEEYDGRPSGRVFRLGLSDRVLTHEESGVKNYFLTGSKENCIYKLLPEEAVLGPVMIDEKSVEMANEYYEDFAQPLFEGMSVVRPMILNPISVSSGALAGLASETGEEVFGGLVDLGTIAQEEDNDGENLVDKINSKPTLLLEMNSIRIKDFFRLNFTEVNAKLHSLQSLSVDNPANKRWEEIRQIWEGGEEEYRKGHPDSEEIKFS